MKKLYQKCKLLQHSPLSTLMLEVNFNKLKSVLSSFDFTFNVIAVSETWLNNDDLDYFHMDDYDDIHTCRPNRGGGGVALYVNRLLQSKPLPLLSKCILNCAEVICTEIIIPNGKNIVVASVYRAPNTDLSMLNDHIEYIFNKCKNKKVTCVAILMWIY